MMRSHYWMSFAAGVILTAASECRAQNPEFYYIPADIRANQLQVVSNAQHFSNGMFQRNNNDSGVASAQAGTSVAAMDADKTYSLSVTTSITNYSQNRMNLSGSGGQSYVTTNGANLGATNFWSLTPQPGNQRAPMRYYGRIASDVHPTGYPCVVSGTISMTWGFSGTGTVASRASAFSVTNIGSDGSGSGIIGQYRVTDNNDGSGTEAVFGQSAGQIPFDQNINSVSGSPSTLSYSSRGVVPVGVGDIIEIDAMSIEQCAAYVNGTDSQTFVIIADVTE